MSMEQGKRSKKKHLSKEAFRKSERLGINKLCGRFINIRDRMKITKSTKKHYTKQQMKFKILSKILNTN